jgi:hypothetical protein
MPDERGLSCEGGAQSVREILAAGDQLNVHLIDSLRTRAVPLSLATRDDTRFPWSPGGDGGS